MYSHNWDDNQAWQTVHRALRALPGESLREAAERVRRRVLAMDKPPKLYAVAKRFRIAEIILSREKFSADWDHIHQAARIAQGSEP